MPMDELVTVSNGTQIRICTCYPKNPIVPKPHRPKTPTPKLKKFYTVATSPVVLR